MTPLGLLAGSLLLFALSAWSATAIWFQAPGGARRRQLLVGLWLLFSLLALIALWCGHARAALVAFGLGYVAVLLWWLLDKSANQRATAALVSLTQRLLPSAALTLRVPPVRRFVISVDELIREALFGDPVSA